MHKILFHIGFIPIYSYGFMIAMGFIFAIACGLKYGKDRNFTFEQIVRLENLILLTGILGARLLYVILNFTSYWADPLKILNIRTGGLSWHGAIVAGVIAMLWFARREGFSFWDVGDISTLCGTLGLAFGRIGCFLHGCCYGKPSDLPWAVVFPDLGPSPRHPTQIYEALLDILLFLILLHVWKKNKFKGEVFCCFLGFYSAIRFFVEFFREGSQNSRIFGSLLFGLNLAQIASLLIIVFTLFLYRKLYFPSKSC